MNKKWICCRCGAKVKKTLVEPITGKRVKNNVNWLCEDHIPAEATRRWKRAIKKREAMKEPSFKDYIVINKAGDRRVTWEWIGEGWSGDYNEDDKSDTPLLRFSCDEKIGDAWIGMDDASYCTRMPIKSPKKYLKRGAEIILEAIADISYKRRLEELSWFCPEDFKNKV